MHRSGTSAVSGMLEDQGFATGVGREEGKADNPFGTREDRGLVRLDRSVLELNGCEWDRPPIDSAIRFTASYVRRRDRLVAGIASRATLLKDPRMVLLREFWSGVPLRPIGVIRNPVAVTDSLLRREPERTAEECLRLWHVYNTHLLRWLEVEPFPVIVFGGENDLQEEVRLALGHYGLAVHRDFRFFDAELIRSDDQGVKWRQEVPAAFCSLWDGIVDRYRPESSGRVDS